MSIFDAMSPLEAVANDQRKVPERPVLQLATPDTPPVKEHDPGFDWNQWDAGWHNKPWAKGDIKHGRGMPSCNDLTVCLVSLLIGYHCSSLNSCCLTSVQISSQPHRNPYHPQPILSHFPKTSHIYPNVKNVA